MVSGRVLSPPSPLAPMPWLDRPVPRLWGLASWVVEYGLLLAVYLAVNAATAKHGVAVPLLPFEARIPLVPAAFPVYASVYLEAALPIVLLRTTREYLRLQAGCVVMSLLAFAVFALAPMAYPRPHPDLHGAVQALLAAEWTVDGPACTFPSLHVAFAWLLAFALGGKSGLRRALWWINAALISVATLLVKQHFLVDVVAGIALASGVWAMVPRLGMATERAIQALWSRFQETDAEGWVGEP
jgi:membrane-associated phospholipid phosphatase